MTVFERFFAKTKRADSPRPGMATPCLEWTASAKCKQGYGGFTLNGVTELAHRVAWWIRFGVWPSKLLLHKCDNVKCVDTEHLFEGTDADNAADRESKGRGKRQHGDRHWSRLCPEKIPRGEGHGCASLGEQDVIRMRILRAAGWSTYRLADEFGVAQSTASSICRRKTWSHVE